MIRYFNGTWQCHTVAESCSNHTTLPCRLPQAHISWVIKYLSKITSKYDTFQINTHRILRYFDRNTYCFQFFLLQTFLIISFSNICGQYMPMAVRIRVKEYMYLWKLVCYVLVHKKSQVAFPCCWDASLMFVRNLNNYQGWASVLFCSL